MINGSISKCLQPVKLAQGVQHLLDGISVCVISRHLCPSSVECVEDTVPGNRLVQQKW